MVKQVTLIKMLGALISVILGAIAPNVYADLVISPNASHPNYSTANTFVVSPLKQPYHPRMSLDQGNKQFCEYLKRNYRLRRGLADYRSQESARGAYMRYTWMCDKGKTEYISSTTSKLGRSYFKPRQSTQIFSK